MNDATNKAQGGGFKITPGDVIFTLFRHKKKILIFLFLGLASGLATYKFFPKSYTSSAQLLIKYVTEKREILSEEGGTRTLTLGGRGSENVMRTELAILNSADLAISISQNSEELKSKVPENEDPDEAINPGIISAGLKTSSSYNGNIVTISFTHSDPVLAQEILKKTIDTYLQRHIAVHQDRGTFDDFLTQQTDQAKARLMQTEEELIAARSNAGLISIEDARQNISNEIGNLRQLINSTKVDIVENQEIYNQLTKVFESTQTEKTPEESVETKDSGEDETALAIRNYERTRTVLEVLKTREKALLTRYTPESSRYRALVEQIEATEIELQSIIDKHPETFTKTTSIEEIASFNPEEAANNAKRQEAKISSLNSRLKTLSTQLAELQAEAKRVDQAELKINDIQRRKNLDESNYRVLLSNLEKNRLDDAQSDGHVSNITIIQSPTPAYSIGKLKLQVSGGVTGGVMVIGLVWALLVDLLLDRSIKRPTEIQRNLGIPLFMSLPDLNDKRFRKSNAKASRQHLLQVGKIKQLEASKKKSEYKPKSPTLQAAALSRPDDYGNSNSEAIHTIAPWEDQHALNEHFDALRDKVITYFESKNLTHKPKLIAMTGLGQGSGVTTIASGLAGSLSKIGEGNVLLVDMTLGQETAQKFYKGKNIMSLDEVLESENEGQAKIENKLYVVAEGNNGTKLPRIMPQRFNKIMPKLRASEFDYIIFDMPPVSAISSTPRLASFMDIVLMVMESEKTNRDVATQALELLADSKAHLGGILNKTKSHVPKKLEQDLLSQS